ncbi:MAG: hypothetical protein KGL59_01110 [Acidobacteriota bacterium]|nr:hypothetical protein [Acidobacteriota bacterium]
MPNSVARQPRLAREEARKERIRDRRSLALLLSLVLFLLLLPILDDTEIGELILIVSLYVTLVTAVMQLATYTGNRGDSMRKACDITTSSATAAGNVEDIDWYDVPRPASGSLGKRVLRECELIFRGLCTKCALRRILRGAMPELLLPEMRGRA